MWKEFIILKYVGVMVKNFVLWKFWSWFVLLGRIGLCEGIFCVGEKSN